MQGKLGPLIFLVTASIHFTSSQAEDPDGQLSHQNELCQSICIGRLAHFTGCCDAVTLFMYKNEKRSSLYGGEERFGKRMMDMERFGKRMMDMDRFGKRMMDMDRFGKRMMDEDRFGKRMMDEDRFGKRRRKRSSSDSEDILEPSSVSQPVVLYLEEKRDPALQEVLRMGKRSDIDSVMRMGK